MDREDFQQLPRFKSDKYIINFHATFANQIARKKRYMKRQVARIEIGDTTQLERYCRDNSSVPTDDHVPFVAYYEISGVLLNISNLCIYFTFCKTHSLFFVFFCMSNSHIDNRCNGFGEPEVCCDLVYKGSPPQVGMLIILL